MSTEEPNQATESPQPTESPSDWTEKQLPPVKPPTTGLLVQLFFVPMIIVSIIVAVWLMFGWLAQSGNNPEKLTKNLKQLNKGSWQDAHSLSELLKDPREQELRQDHATAKSLAETLNSLLDDKALRANDQRHLLATWLCRALGEFEVDDGLDTLIRATNFDDFEIRRAAVQAISKLSAKLDDIRSSRSDIVQILKSPALERTESLEREDVLKYGEMRSAAGYALGLIGGDDATDTLALMLSDPYPEARYNAATGLARNGDLRCVPRLVEMLNLNNDEAVLHEQTEKASLLDWKRNLVIVNGLRGVHALYQNTEAPIDKSIISAIANVESSGTLRGNDASVLKEVQRFIRDRT